VKFRSLDAYRQILEQNDVKNISLAPMYSILGWPFTGKKRLDGQLTFLYTISTQLYKRFKLCTKIAYYVDSCLTQFKLFGMSTWLLVGKKEAN